MLKCGIFIIAEKNALHNSWFFECHFSALGSERFSFINWKILASLLSQTPRTLPQVAGRRRSPMPSQRQVWRTPSPQPAARATWVSAAAIERSRATTTTRKQGGSGVAVRPTSSTGLSSHGALWMPGKLRKTPGASWTCTTMRLGERWRTISQETVFKKMLKAYFVLHLLSNGFLKLVFVKLLLASY